MYTELFARLSDVSPVVAITDDMQWADLDTIPLFKQLVSGPIPPRMLLLCSFRTDNLDAHFEIRSPSLEQGSFTWIAFPPCARWDTAAPRAG